MGFWGNLFTKFFQQKVLIKEISQTFRSTLDKVALYRSEVKTVPVQQNLLKGLIPFLKTKAEAKRFGDDFLEGKAVW